MFKFYWKQAWQLVRKNLFLFFPFILCIAINQIVLYSITAFKTLSFIKNSMFYKQFLMILGLGEVVIFLLIIGVLLFAYSYVFRYHMKNFSLYNVLGMNKKGISKIIIRENIILYVISTVIGSISSIFVYNLLAQVLANFLEIKIKEHFLIDFTSLKLIIITFAIFMIILTLKSIYTIKKNNSLDLLKSENNIVKIPKAKPILAIISLIALITGYYIAATTKLDNSFIHLFILAIILVIFGIYGIFVYFISFVIKLVSNNHNFYYQTNNMISTSILKFHIRENAKSLASITIIMSIICITLSCVILVKQGVKNTINKTFPYDIQATSFANNQNELENYQNIVKGYIANNNQDIAYTSYLNYGNFIKIDNRSYLAISPNTYSQITGHSLQLNNDEIITNGDIHDFKKNQLVTKKKVHTKFDIISTFIDTPHKYLIIMNNPEQIQNYLRKPISQGYQYSLQNTYLIKFKKLDNKKREKLALTASKTIDSAIAPVKLDCKEIIKQSFLTLFSGLIFVGLFVVIILSSTLIFILYYKQFNQALVDAKTYKQMIKIGFPKNHIKQIINKQNRIIFGLPIIFTILNVIFAYPLFNKVLSILLLGQNDLINILLIISVVILVIYLLIYLYTSKMYTSLVNKEL